MWIDIRHVTLDILLYIYKQEIITVERIKQFVNITTCVVSLRIAKTPAGSNRRKEREGEYQSVN